MWPLALPLPWLESLLPWLVCFLAFFVFSKADAGIVDLVGGGEVYLGQGNGTFVAHGVTGCCAISVAAGRECGVRRSSYCRSR